MATVVSPLAPVRGKGNPTGRGGGGGGGASPLDEDDDEDRAVLGGGGTGDGNEWRARFAGGGDPIACRRAVDVVARLDSFDSSASSLATRRADRCVLTGDGDTRKRLRGVLRALGAGDRNFARG